MKLPSRTSLPLSGLGLIVAVALMSSAANAKLPPPPAPTDEQKAKAAEAAAKTAWTAKVADYQLCRSMDRAASNYFEVAKRKGTAAAADPAAPSCTDPGPFAATPPAPKPLEAAGAHSPPQTAASPPNTKTPAAEIAPAPKKP